MKKVLIAAFAAALLAPVAAETIRMRDGTYHSGEVVSSDDEIVRIRFAENGLELDLKWDQLAGGEAQRLKARSAMEKASRFLMAGEVIYTTRNETLEGIVLEENADKLKMKTAKGTKDVNIKSIARREKTQINALSVYTPDELYASKSPLYKLDTASGNFDLGDLCLAISLFAKAKEHFAKTLELDATWKSRVDPRMAKAEAGIREAEAAAMMKEAEELTAKDKLEEAVAKYKEIVEKYPGTAAATKAAELANKGEGNVTALKSEQKKEADKKRAKAYYDEMKSLVGKAVAAKLTFQQLKDYVEKTMTGEILDKLAEREKADRKQFEADWRSRELDDWKQASYGEGSWMMEPDQLAIEKSTNLDDIRNKNKNAQLITDLKAAAAAERKLVDAWWTKQTTTVKINWLSAYAAEKTMLTKPPDHAPCSKCAGKGILGATALCMRCLGIGQDRVISYK
ncbi:MAG: hypothetical protein K8T20_11995 [Planctomycetes bacterium]|nr:hypothetical protein [Planctomycetota bacterium]